MAPRLPTLDLFSGIGGHAWALKSILRTIAYCEIDPVARAIITHNIAHRRLDTAPIFEDITELHARNLPSTPCVITASFPCQNISSAGARAGILGAQSKLFFEVMRLIDEIGRDVTTIWLENVQMIRIRGLDIVLSELHKRHFKCAWGYFSAAEVGADHLRVRWYCLALRGRATAQIPLAPSPKFDFQNKLPRLILKKDTNVGLNRLRISLLGNAIVPDTCKFAWTCLAKVLNGVIDPLQTQNGGLKDILFYADKKVIRYFKRPAGGRYKPIKLCIDGIPSKSWSTPVHTQTHLYPQTVCKGRTRFMFATQIFHEAGTKIKFGFTRVNDAVKDKWILNPDWVTKLMGFPAGWTDVATK